MTMNFNEYIDHTNLKPDAKESDIEKLCREAIEYGFASVCVNSANVSLASRLLENSDVKVCSVIGFPLGASITEVKAFETVKAIEHGADEIDMVINVGNLKDGLYVKVENDIRSVVKAANGKTVKVIIETCLLTNDEKISACKIACKAGADFVKTSTGFSNKGAIADDVALMREIVGEEMGVKAAGGIRNSKTMIAMIRSGANRIGASHSVDICKELNKKHQK